MILILAIRKKGKQAARCIEFEFVLLIYVHIQIPGALNFPQWVPYRDAYRGTWLRYIILFI